MKIRNISDQDLVIPNVGIVAPGAVIDAPEGFHNANFERVDKPGKVVPPKEGKEDTQPK